jgi:hypothetical protein
VAISKCWDRSPLALAECTNTFLWVFSNEFSTLERGVFLDCPHPVLSSHLLRSRTPAVSPQFGLSTPGSYNTEACSRGHFQLWVFSNEFSTSERGVFLPGLDSSHPVLNSHLLTAGSCPRLPASEKANPWVRPEEVTFLLPVAKAERTIVVESLVDDISKDLIGNYLRPFWLLRSVFVHRGARS